MKEQGVIIQSVDRALQILDCFTGPVSELGITELAHAMGLGKSTIYGLVNTLLITGYLEQNPENKRYRLGLKLFEMGSIVQRRMDIREIAKPYLKELSEKYNMTVHMGLYRDGEVMYIDKMDSPDTRIVFSQVGKRAPMYCTGIGKAIFANMEKDEIERLLNIQKREELTEKTIMKPDKILEELQKIKNQGYAVDNEEVELGLRCVAVPIFNHQKRPIAAISISSSVSILNEEKIRHISADLRKVALEISKKLGYNESN
jgi:DNA-binding IclR family transcriptional regulator